MALSFEDLYGTKEAKRRRRKEKRRRIEEKSRRIEEIGRGK